MPIIFESEEELYATGRDARYAGEHDFGVNWRGTRVGPSYRVSWSEATHELWAVASPSGRVILLASIPRLDEVESILDGWTKWSGNRSLFGERNGMKWLIEKLEQSGRLVPDDPTKEPVHF